MAEGDDRILDHRRHLTPCAVVGVSGPEPYSGGRIVSFAAGIISVVAAGIVSSRTGRRLVLEAPLDSGLSPGAGLFRAVPEPPNEPLDRLRRSEKLFGL